MPAAAATAGDPSARANAAQQHAQTTSSPRGPRTRGRKWPKRDRLVEPGPQKGVGLTRRRAYGAAVYTPRQPFGSRTPIALSGLLKQSNHRAPARSCRPSSRSSLRRVVGVRAAVADANGQVVSTRAFGGVHVLPLGQVGYIRSPLPAPRPSSTHRYTERAMRRRRGGLGREAAAARCTGDSLRRRLPPPLSTQIDAACRGRSARPRRARLRASVRPCGQPCDVGHA